MNKLQVLCINNPTVFVLLAIKWQIVNLNLSGLLGTFWQHSKSAVYSCNSGDNAALVRISKYIFENHKIITPFTSISIIYPKGFIDYYNSFSFHSFQLILTCF